MWAPPPGGARHDLEDFQQDWHKIHESLHIFVCPSLLFTERIPPLYFSADIIIEIKAGNFYFLPSEMHETLIVVLLFSYI